jgi:hypothetical protein
MLPVAPDARHWPLAYGIVGRGLWADGGFDADHGLAFDGVGRPAPGSLVIRG